MARQGLPKKYAKMGFKRGWKAYKASKRGRSRPRTYKAKTARRRSNPGGYKKAKKWVKKQWGLGRIISSARYADIISRPFQGALGAHGLTKQGLEEAGDRYSGGLIKGKKFSTDKFKHTYGGMGTGIAVNFIKSKAGVFRGAGKGKIISVVQALSPEIIASLQKDPLKDSKEWNDVRSFADAGYIPSSNTWIVEPTGVHGNAFWNDKYLNLSLGAIQKIVFNTNGPIGLNKYLPKGVNL